jgi:hypothetical protein
VVAIVIAVMAGYALGDDDAIDIAGRASENGSPGRQ